MFISTPLTKLTTFIAPLNQLHSIEHKSRQRSPCSDFAAVQTDQTAHVRMVYSRDVAIILKDGN